MKNIYIKICAVCVILASADINSYVKTATKQTATQSPSPTLTYSANVIYPTEIYCPAGIVCSYAAPTFLITV